MSPTTVRGVEARLRWRRMGWALPWLLFQAFPIADLVRTPRPAAVVVIGAAGLLVFTAAYLSVFGRMFGGARGSRWPRRELLVVAVLGVVLSAWFGPGWAGLMIYVSAAAAAGLPERWVWPAVAGSAAVCAGVLAPHRLLPSVPLPADRLRTSRDAAPHLGQRRTGRGPRGAGPQRRRGGAAALRP